MCCYKNGLLKSGCFLIYNDNINIIVSNFNDSLLDNDKKKEPMKILNIRGEMKDL